MASPLPERIKRNLATLIAFDTQNPPGREVEAASWLRSLFDGLGFETSLDEFRSGRANVIARLENGPGPVFAFNTHMDVVPSGADWTSNPFVLREENGRLYGRGACDCKGPLAAMIEALHMLAADRTSWSGTLLGVFVADEEVASGGARSFAATQPRVDYVVVGEPTSNATFSGHKGSLRPVVRVHGIASHSGMPDLGDNAIYRSAQLLRLIEEFHEGHVRNRSHPLCGRASLTVTRINGGEADNVLPSHVDILLDRRMVPGEDEAVARGEIETLLEQAREHHGVNAEIIAYRPTTGGPAETPRDEPIVQASLDACRRHGTAAPGPLGLSGACDLVHFRALGAAGTVVGPGSLAMAHKPDEYVLADELVAASLIYRDIAQEMMKP